MGTFLISEAAVASTIISSLIMSNKATHRQTAHPLPHHALHIDNKLISRWVRISKEILKKRERDLLILVCDFCPKTRRVGKKPQIKTKRRTPPGFGLQVRVTVTSTVR